MQTKNDPLVIFSSIKTQFMHTHHKIRIRPIRNIILHKHRPALRDGIRASHSGHEELVDMPQIRVRRTQAKHGHDKMQYVVESELVRLFEVFVPSLEGAL